MVLDSDTTASSLEECRVGWDALDGGLGDFPLHMEPGLDPEDTDPGPSGAPPLSAPPPGRRPPGEVLGGNEGGGAPSPSSQRNCREECSMRERSPGGGSQELAIRFESPGGGDEDGPYIHLSCLKRIAATLSEPLASVEVGQVMQSSAPAQPRPPSGGAPWRLEPVAAEKGTLALHLLPSAELALIWFPDRPAGRRVMFSGEDTLPGSVIAALPCRGAAPAQPGAGRTASVAVEWAGADQTGRTFCIRTDLAPWHPAVPAVTFRRFFWLRAPDLGAARALVEEMRKLLGKPPSVAEVLGIDPAVVRALAPLVRGQPPVGGAGLPKPEAAGLANHAAWVEPPGGIPPPAERALAAALSPAGARHAREAKALRRSLAQTGLSSQYRDGGGGGGPPRGLPPLRKLPMGLKPGFLAARPGASRGKPRPARLALGDLDFDGRALEAESDFELDPDLDLDSDLELDLDLELVGPAEPCEGGGRAGPPSCAAEAPASKRVSSGTHRPAAAESVAVEPPALAGAPRAEGGTVPPPPPGPVNVSLANLMEIMGDAGEDARPPRDVRPGEGRPPAAPLRAAGPGCASGTAPRPRNLRSARCSPTGPPSPEEGGKVDVRNIRELMKPAACKPPAP